MGIQFWRAICFVAVVALATSAPTGAYEPKTTITGFGSFMAPLQEPPHQPFPDQFNGQRCWYCKDHVYIFAVNGIDPLCTGNFDGLCNYIRRQGFVHTNFAQLHNYHSTASTIRSVRNSDAQARIMLMGFSMGARVAKSIANDLARDNTRIDVLFYLAGDLIDNSPSSRPANVIRVVNLRAHGFGPSGGDLFFNGADLDGARNQWVECRHMLAPSRRETIILLNEELQILSRVCEPLLPPTNPSENNVLVLPAGRR